jgi:hypothetical protein
MRWPRRRSLRADRGAGPNCGSARCDARHGRLLAAAIWHRELARPGGLGQARAGVGVCGHDGGCPGLGGRRSDQQLAGAVGTVCARRAAAAWSGSEVVERFDVERFDDCTDGDCMMTRVLVLVVVAAFLVAGLIWPWPGPWLPASRRSLVRGAVSVQACTCSANGRMWPCEAQGQNLICR